MLNPLTLFLKFVNSILKLDWPGFEVLNDGEDPRNGVEDLKGSVGIGHCEGS